ncbi:hypothetical protein FACS1894216_20330 [Synergistales bacterium]|nr:hypothetical protein FACS1894216_20330 [Synergistales bacterium]
MVRGLDSFKAWFQGYERNYAIIGGTACHLLMSEAGTDFRGTRDIDMVLIIEALNANFGTRFWEYVKAGGYEHYRKSTDTPQFYRFTKPAAPDYPYMIELFSRRMDGILLPEEAVLTPLPIEEDISSLSAILLDDGYYEFLKSGVRIMDGLPILDASHIIPFKAKAWLDLTERKANGGQVDSKHIKKHKNDVIALSGLLRADSHIELPENVRADFAAFIAANSADTGRLQRVAMAYEL